VLKIGSPPRTVHTVYLHTASLTGKAAPVQANLAHLLHHAQDGMARAQALEVCLALLSLVVIFLKYFRNSKITRTLLPYPLGFLVQPCVHYFATEVT
jgi:hypothetical protein